MKVHVVITFSIYGGNITLSHMMKSSLPLPALSCGQEFCIFTGFEGLAPIKMLESDIAVCANS